MERAEPLSAAQMEKSWPTKAEQLPQGHLAGCGKDGKGNEARAAGHWVFQRWLALSTYDPGAEELVVPHLYLGLGLKFSKHFRIVSVGPGWVV